MWRPATALLPDMRGKNMEKTLKPGDYILPSGEGVWVRVGGMVIYIRNRGEACDVEAYEAGKEMETPVEAFTVYSDEEA
jgi:hypothetical protein